MGQGIVLCIFGLIIIHFKLLCLPKVPHYIFGQYLGALIGALVVFLLYWDALVWYEHQQGVYRSVPDTAIIFSSLKLKPLTMSHGSPTSSSLMNGNNCQVSSFTPSLTSSLTSLATQTNIKF